MTTELQTYIKQFLQAKRLKAKQTQVFYEKGLRFYALAYPDWPITDTNITNFLVDIFDRGCKPTTVHAYFRAMRTFCNWLHKRKVITDNPILLVDPPKLPFLLPRAPQSKHISKLLDLLSNLNDWYIVRDKAIIVTALDTGCRISELAAFTIDDLDLANKTLLVKQSKTKRQRLLVFHEFTQYCLSQWLAHRAALGANTKRLFVGGRNGGMILPFEARGMRAMFNRRLNEAAIDHCRFHDLRHAYAVYSLQNGASLLDVCKQLGHANISTTNVYTQLVDIGRVERHHNYSPVARIGGAV